MSDNEKQGLTRKTMIELLTGQDGSSEQRAAVPKSLGAILQKATPTARVKFKSRLEISPLLGVPLLLVEMLNLRITQSDHHGTYLFVRTNDDRITISQNTEEWQTDRGVQIWVNEVDTSIIIFWGNSSELAEGIVTPVDMLDVQNWVEGNKRQGLRAQRFNPTAYADVVDFLWKWLMVTE